MIEMPPGWQRNISKTCGCAAATGKMLLLSLVAVMNQESAKHLRHEGGVNLGFDFISSCRQWTLT